MGEDAKEKGLPFLNSADSTISEPGTGYYERIDSS